MVFIVCKLNVAEIGKDENLCDPDNGLIVMIRPLGVSIFQAAKLTVSGREHLLKLSVCDENKGCALWYKPAEVLLWHKLHKIVMMVLWGPGPQLTQDRALLSIGCIPRDQSLHTGRSLLL